MKFKYVGQKADGERAFMDKTGIEWFPGDEKEVDHKEAVALMLQHQTVWEPVGQVSLADAKAAPKPLVNVGHVSDEDVLDDAEAREQAAKDAAKAPAQVMAEAKTSAMAEVSIQDALDGMDDDGVREFAKAHGLKVQAIALTKGANLRAKVAAAMAEAAKPAEK
jgi:hypothetical protein